MCPAKWVLPCGDAHLFIEELVNVNVNGVYVHCGCIVNCGCMTDKVGGHTLYASWGSPKLVYTLLGACVSCVVSLWP